MELTPGLMILILCTGGLIGIVAAEFYQWVAFGQEPERADSPADQRGSGAAETRLVYLCHKYADNPTKNAARVLEVVKTIKAVFTDTVVIAPQIYLPQFFNEETERAAAMRNCLALLQACPEMWVEITDPALSAGMSQEIDCCRKTGIRVRFFTEKDGRVIFLPENKGRQK